VDDTGNVTQNGQQDVDEEISAAATLEEDTHGREDDGKEDLADVASSERHDVGVEELLLEEEMCLIVVESVVSKSLRKDDEAVRAEYEL